MKKILYLLFIVFAQIFIVQKAFATHIIGGEMNYKCLGNNKYQITLTIYRDCFNGVPPFDSIAQVGIFNNKFQLIDSIQMKLNPDDTIKVALSDTCLFVPKNVCVHTTTYIDTITLLPIAGGYILAYQRCCRNFTIVNIIEPNKTGATFSVVISEDAIKACNSSAKFKNWPPIFICVNEPIKFDIPPSLLTVIRSFIGSVHRIWARLTATRNKPQTLRQRFLPNHLIRLSLGNRLTI